MSDQPTHQANDAAPDNDESYASPLAPTHDPDEDVQPRSAYPRSIKRRLEQTTQPPSRVRSQPLNVTPEAARPRRVREPVLVEWEPEPMHGPWRAKPLVVGAAVVAWLAALALLIVAPAQLAASGLPPRLAVPLVWMLAAALTFVPVQLRLGIPGVGWQGMLGWGLLGYLLAFVPAPSDWLLGLPDLPVYLLLFFAVFYSVTSAMLPLTYLLGQRFYKLRIHRLDVGRARRQAYEIGLLVVATLVMASLRVLSPITFGLLALVVVLTEALLLSQVQPEG